MSMFSDKGRDGAVVDKLKSLPTIGSYHYDGTQAFLISEIEGFPFVRFSSTSHALITVSLEEELRKVGVTYDPENHYVAIGFSTGDATKIQFRVRHVMPNYDLAKIQNVLSSQSLGIDCQFIIQ